MRNHTQSLNRDQYKKICRACDEVLLDPFSKNITKAIPWLYVLRWHPEYLKQYTGLFNTNKQVDIIKTPPFRIFRFNFISLLYIAKSIWERLFNFRRLNLNKVDLLIVSHFVSKKNSEDFYYGNLEEILNQRGISSSTVMINHTSETDKSISNNFPSIILLRKVLSFFLEVRLYLSQQREYFRLVRKSSSFSGFKMRVYREAAINALSPNTASTFRTAYQIKKILSESQAKFIIVTYEGYAWERIVFNAAKEINPNIKCIGYQHAAVFRYPHSSIRMLRDSFNPDLILTTGSVTRNQFENNNLSSDVKLIEVGSKQAPQSSKIEGIDSTKKLVKCLVAPESFEKEIIILFDFSIECARKNPGMEFNWRLHPMINFEDLIKKNPHYNNLPGNITLSTDKLEVDLENSSFILYRGSTVVIPAISHGIIPIYFRFNNDEGESFDAIYDCNKGRQEVTSSKEFSAIVKRSYDSNVIGYLKNYGNDFYKPFDTDSLVKYIRQYL